MSEFESHSYNQGAHGAAPIESKNKGWWRRAKEILLAIRSKGARTKFSAAVNRGRSILSSRNAWVGIVLAILLVVPVAGLIFGYIMRPALAPSGAGSAAGISADNPARGTAAKPAPGKPLYPVMQPPSTAVVAPIPAPAAPRNPSAATPPPPQANAPIMPAPPPQIAGVMPPPPTVTTNAPYAPTTYPARHDKHFGDGCSGQLTLNSNELVFECPEDPRGSVQVAINQIDAVDENGIRLSSGKKYHFSIPGMSKNSEQELFTGWLNRVR
jgi:hypothetical protein